MSAGTGTATTTIAHDIPPTAEGSRRALGAFLRQLRERAKPALAATPAPTRRRARGMRREEVAVSAGISVTWYTWLEQARPVRVSPETLSAIATALGATDVERAHLLRLAAAADRSTQAFDITGSASDNLRRLVDRVAPHAAYAVNGLWHVLHANAEAADLLGDFFAVPDMTDNVLARLFLDADWTRRFRDIQLVRTTAVAQFRAASAALVDDPRWQTFVARLSAASEDFRVLWNRRDVAVSESWEKTIAHPRRGLLEMRYSSLAPDGEPPDVRVVVYVPAR